jgi:hypothetical protein
LEARGIRVFIADLQTHDLFGFFHGAGTPPRVMVPAKDVAAAQAIAEDLVGSFDALTEVESSDPVIEHPMRPVPCETLPEGADDEEGADEISANSKKPKSRAIPIIFGLSGLALLGASHFYVGRVGTAMLLFFFGMVGFGMTMGGDILGPLVLATVWLCDVIGGVMGVVANNRQLPPAR